MIRKIFRFGFLRVLSIFIIVLPGLLGTSVLAAGSYPYASGSTEVSNALTYLHTQQGTDGKIADFATSAWAVMAIKAAGQDPNSWKASSSSPTIVDYLSTNANNATATNDYSRMIIAIAAAGKDPTNFGGRNFLSLLEASYDGTQIGDNTLLNDDFWGVMALIAAGVPASSSIIQGSVSFILSHQNTTDGGWSYGVGQSSDVDDTAAAIMALTAAGQSTSSKAITRALSYMKNNQASSGGFLSWGSTNSSTDSWAIAGIVAAGQDPTGADWKSSGGNDPVDDLLSFQNADGSFNWTSATPSNLALNTSYAIVALLGTPYPVAKPENILTTPVSTMPASTTPTSIALAPPTSLSTTPTTPPTLLPTIPTLTTPATITPVSTTSNPPVSTTNWTFIGSIIGAIIVIGIVAAVVLRRKKSEP